MNEGTVFGLLVILILTYVIVGNVIYLGKVVPYLTGKKKINGASLIPSEQFKHLHQYAVESQQDGIRSLSVVIANNFVTISVALIVIVLALLLMLVFI